MAQSLLHINQPSAAMVSRSRAWQIFGMATLAGIVLAIVWNFEFVDLVLGDTIANTVIGGTAKNAELSPAASLFGMLFSLAAGLAATFTACNCVVFSCVAPLAAEKRQHTMWRTIGWMALGIVLTTALYGVIGAFVGKSMPMLSDAKLNLGIGYPVRLAQSSLVFVTLGAVFAWWGLHTLGLLPNPLARLMASRPWVKPLLLGIVVGCFTVGRPFGLFRKAFENAVLTGNPLFSGAAMALQGLSNILVMVVVLLVLVYGTGGRFERWLRANPQRITTITAVSVLVGGVFFMAYWGLRVPSIFKIGWFPHFG